jgi:hypothetical protein
MGAECDRVPSQMALIDVNWECVVGKFRKYKIFIRAYDSSSGG